MRFLRGMYRAFRRLFSPGREKLIIDKALKNGDDMLSPGREKLDIQVADAMELDDLFDEGPRGSEGEGTALAGDFKIFSSKDEYNREFLSVFQSFKSSFLLDYSHRDGHFRV